MRATVLALVLLVLGPAAAVAEEPALSWARLPGAEGCVSALELARMVEARIGRPVLEAPSRASLSIEGHVRPVGEAGGGGWSALVTVRDRRGARLGQRELRVSGEDCRALDLPVSLVVSLAIDGDAMKPLRMGEDPLSTEARGLLSQLELAPDDPQAHAELLSPTAQGARVTATPRAEAAGDGRPRMVLVTREELRRLRELDRSLRAAAAEDDGPPGPTPRWPGYVLLGSGALMAGLTVYSNLELQRASDDGTFAAYRRAIGMMNPAASDACVEAERGVPYGLDGGELARVREQCDRGATFEVLQWVFLAGSATTLGLGAAWLLWIADDGESAPEGGARVSLRPALTPQRAALTLRVDL